MQQAALTTARNRCSEAMACAEVGVADGRAALLPEGGLAR